MVEAPPAEVSVHSFPWRYVGRVTRPSTGFAGGGTGTYIGVGSGGFSFGSTHFVLAAAHSVYPGGQWPAYLQFALARNGLCIPYGNYQTGRVWIPKKFAGIDGMVPQTVEERSANDYAIIELSNPANYAAGGAPPAVPLPNWMLQYRDPFAWNHLTPRTVGYACGRLPDQPSATGGTIPGFCRADNVPYLTTADNASILGFEEYSDGAALIRTNMEGTTGMSGGPVWVEANSPTDFAALGGPVHVIGIAVGAPCVNGVPAENWVAMLTPSAHARIEAIVNTGSHPEMLMHDFTVCMPTAGGGIFCYGSGGGEVGSCTGL